MPISDRLLLLLLLTPLLCSSQRSSGIKGNETMPYMDYHIPNCQRLITWEPVFDSAGIGVRLSQCSVMVRNGEVLPMSWVFSFLQILKDRTSFDGEMEFFVQQDSGRFCSLVSLKIRRPTYFAVEMASVSKPNSIGCSRDKKKRTNFNVCSRVLCPPVTTTPPPPTTTSPPPPTSGPTSAIAVLKVGLFGMPVDDELLFYRIVIAVLLFLLVLFLILLVQACMRNGRLHRKLSRGECMSNVTIRRVTDDQYSSMGAIGETGSLGGPEFYGSIARRKELHRERKMWLRERSCGGSSGVPTSPDDLNGLLPSAYHGSLSTGGPHRTSVTSLTQGHGNNGSLRRLPSYGSARPPPGPQSVCHLSRQNTADSIPSRCPPIPPPMPPLPPPMPANGHMTGPEEEPQGHMV